MVAWYNVDRGHVDFKCMKLIIESQIYIIQFVIIKITGMFKCCASISLLQTSAFVIYSNDGIS